jgi:hypothetical protein
MSMGFLELQFHKRAQLEADGKRSYSFIGDQHLSTSKPKKLKLISDNAGAALFI